MVVSTGMAAEPQVAGRQAENVVLAVHGGTGMPRRKLTPELEKEYREGIEQALRAGYTALNRPEGSSLDGVETAVKVLEDLPCFNAGRGAVFTREGTIELDASVMSGKDRRAGAVAGVVTIRNPISAARLVMEKSAHVLLIGTGADRFAQSQGLEPVEASYFRTDRRWNDHQELLKQKAPVPGKQHGTVGAVALDQEGHLAAATSTGGMAGKLPGRVGDTPLIGAGTFADDRTCAVSATGHGEFFIRFTVASDIASRMKYRQESVAAAADGVIHGEMEAAGGIGGVIALDAQGRLAMSWNSEGLYRGLITRDGKVAVFLYEE